MISELPKIDFLTVSIPFFLKDDVLFGLLRQVLKDHNPHPISSHVILYGDHKITFGDRFGTFNLSFSGKVLDQMRSDGIYEALIDFLSRPYYAAKPTRVDVCMDHKKPASYCIKGLYRKFKRNPPYLTRKQLPRSKITTILTTSSHEEGLDTGTLYLGNYKTDTVMVKIYDKTHEMITTDQGDPGESWVRYELTLKGKANPTWHDVKNPAHCYFHFLGTRLKLEHKLMRPEKPWEGLFKHPDLVTPNKPVYKPSDVLKRKIAASDELREIAAYVTKNDSLFLRNLLALEVQKLLQPVSNLAQNGKITGGGNDPEKVDSLKS